MNAIVKQEMTPQPFDDGATILAVVSRAATDPNCDIEKMERLLAMSERVATKKAEAEFNAALASVQSKMGRISANAVNSQTRSRYATYGKLDSALRPLYSAEGLSLSFDTEPAGDSMVGMICYVSHTGGHTRTYRAAVPSDGKGAKGNDVMTKTHAFGSGTAYGMRYLLKMIFNVAIGEEDDDGQRASGGSSAASVSALDEWKQAIEECATKAELLAYKEQIAGLSGDIKAAVAAAYNAKNKTFATKAE